jgi:hypothetical protein
MNKYIYIYIVYTHMNKYIYIHIPEYELWILHRTTSALPQVISKAKGLHNREGAFYMEQVTSLSMYVYKEGKMYIIYVVYMDVYISTPNYT